MEKGYRDLTEMEYKWSTIGSTTLDKLHTNLINKITLFCMDKKAHK